MFTGNVGFIEVSKEGRFLEAVNEPQWYKSLHVPLIPCD